MQQNDSQDSLLEDLFQEPPFIEEYLKRIKRARITLFILAGIQLFSLSVYFLRDYSINFNFIFIILIGVAYAALALWTKKKPYTAIILALILYTGFFAYFIIEYRFIIFYTYSWLTGIPIRIVVYIMLISALKGAKQVQIWQDTMQKNK